MSELNIIMEYFIIPLLIILFGSAIIIVKSYVDRYSAMIVAKNQIELINITTDTLEKIVSASVSSTMRMANKMKRSKRKLTPEQALRLNKAAKKLINNTLPNGLLPNGMNAKELLGGDHGYNSIIDSLIEKSVIEVKNISK